MNNEIPVFSSETFGSVHAFEKNGMVYFCGAEVAGILGTKIFSKLWIRAHSFLAETVFLSAIAISRNIVSAIWCIIANLLMPDSLSCGFLTA